MTYFVICESLYLTTLEWLVEFEEDSYEPEFFADEFRKYLKQNPEVKTYVSWVSPKSVEFVDAFPDLQHRLICGDVDPTKDDLLVELSKKTNVVLMKDIDEPLN